MIKSNELRIGNYVDYERTTHVVTRLLAHHVSHDWYKSIGEDAYDTSYDSINPIPLTPELLEKCGFVEKDGSDNVHSIFSLNDFHLDFDWRRRQYYSPMEENNGEWVTYGSSIKYLHQLQNLYFALTNKELIINL
jgi:hypothetical protein